MLKCNNRVPNASSNNPEKVKKDELIIVFGKLFSATKECTHARLRDEALTTCAYVFKARVFSLCYYYPIYEP